MLENSTITDICPDCGVPPGEPHDLECDFLRCPKCGKRTHACPCDTPDRTGSIWSGRASIAWTDEVTYCVIEEDFDTRIRRIDGDEGEYGTFGEARDAAIEYLEDLIDSCRFTLDGIRRAERYEEYVSR